MHIRAVLRGEVRLRHSFRGGGGNDGGGGMCRAELTLRLRNCHDSAVASLCVEAGTPSLPAQPGAAAAPFLPPLPPTLPPMLTTSRPCMHPWEGADGAAINFEVVHVDIDNFFLAAGLARWRPGTAGLPAAAVAARAPLDSGSTAAAAAAAAVPAAPPTGSAVAAQPSGCGSCPDYLWVGQTRTVIPALAPGDRTELPLQVGMPK